MMNLTVAERDKTRQERDSFSIVPSAPLSAVTSHLLVMGYLDSYTAIITDQPSDKVESEGVLTATLRKRSGKCSGWSERAYICLMHNCGLVCRGSWACLCWGAEMRKMVMGGKALDVLQALQQDFGEVSTQGREMERFARRLDERNGE